MRPPNWADFLVGFVAFIMTFIGLQNLLEWTKKVSHRKLLLSQGVRVTAYLKAKYTKTVKRGKHGRETIYFIVCEFVTLQSTGTMGTIRNQQCLEQTIQVHRDEHSNHQLGERIPFCYVPSRPTLSERYPPPGYSSSQSVCLWIKYVALSVLGFLFTYWMNAQGPVLLVYLSLLLLYLCFYLVGGCNDLFHAKPVKVPAGVPVAPPPGADEEVDALRQDTAVRPRILPRSLSAKLDEKARAAAASYVQAAARRRQAAERTPV